MGLENDTMMSRKFLRAYIILFLLVWLAPAGTLRAQSITLGQNTISNISKSEPLIITGAIGTQHTYYHSTVGNGYRSPWNNSFYANMNVSVYGISMPFAFYYSNNNTSWNFPHFSIHIDPTYKNWRGHFGRSNMAMSSYIMATSFNGIGLEYNSQKLRFGAFYGQLRNAVNDDPTDPAARKPQYKRMGWGLKAGYGSGHTFIDAYFLRAYDITGSLDERWQANLRPQDNIAIALRGGVGITRWLNLRGNLAYSAFTSDKTSRRIETTEANRWDKIFDSRYTTLMRIAGDVSMNLNLKNFTASMFYRMVQPDYTTLGLYYTSNNYQALGINAATTLFRKISLSASFSGQEDNITRRQLYTTRGFVYNANASTNLGERITLTAGYSGYRQLQTDGTAHPNDSTRANRIMHSLFFTPNYTIDGTTLEHTVALSVNYTQNKDLNRFATGISDVKTLAAGTSYSMGIKPWEMTVTTSFSHQQSDGYNTRYTSDILSVSTGRSFLKEKNLNVSGTLSACYNNVKDQMRNLSMGFDMQCGYTMKKVHVFSMSAGFNKYSDTNISEDQSSRGTTELSVSLGYNYTFSLLEIKKKSRPTPDPSL